ncbi:hypothetical protein SDC9_110266 [bioreactor metagenome]|uniref:Uncharacterized protein n=1 Tax=bioreactor metagenome TaxID=1076179 RepID=A0A645BE46_9ZZZZ
MLCVFYKNETDIGFITGDNPVIVTRVFSNLIGLGSAGLSHQDCVIAFPLNPRIAVSMFHPNILFSHAMRTYSNREYHVTKVETIQQFNKWQFIQANRQVYSQTPISRSTFGPLSN